MASRPAVEAVLGSFRTSLPDIIPHGDKNLSRLLQSVRNLYARPAPARKHGRSGQFPREHLLRIYSQQRMLLGRETSLSVRGFVGQHLPILDFLRDARDVLERGDINLFEAHQLARITPARLEERRSVSTQAESARLAPSGARVGCRGLRARVKELLGELVEPTATETEITAVEKADELLEVDPLDSTHLFYEELRRIGRAIREVRPEELTEADLDQLMPAVDQLGTVLYGIERRRQQQRDKEMKKMAI